jgi:hypothetical protein
MGSITGETNGPSGEPIGPRQILRILQQAISGDSRLKRTSPEHIAKLLIGDGRLPEEISPKLVCEVLEIMREGGMGFREPELQPCSIEFFWDVEAGRVHDGIDLSMSVDRTGAPPIWEKREIPEKLTHDDSRPCTGLLADPTAVLMDKARWPLHLCEPQFTSQSTALWALAQPFAADGLNNQRWAAMWPLPIGRRALMIRPEMADVSAWTSVFGVLPFEEYEQAMWALRIRYREKVSVHTLDLFGLAEYPDEMHQRLAIPVAGKLAFVVRGHGRRPIDLLDAAERWWAEFRGLTLRGRPKGTGTWSTRDDYLAALREAKLMTRSNGDKTTLENVAAHFSPPTTARQLRAWNSLHTVNWLEEKEL